MVARGAFCSRPAQPRNEMQTGMREHTPKHARAAHTVWAWCAHGVGMGGHLRTCFLAALARLLAHVALAPAQSTPLPLRELIQKRRVAERAATKFPCRLDSPLLKARPLDNVEGGASPLEAAENLLHRKACIALSWLRIGAIAAAHHLSQRRRACRQTRWQAARRAHRGEYH